MTTAQLVRRIGPDRSKLALAIEDILRGLQAWRLWTTFAWLDVRQRYRRAMIGPFWITISMGLTVLALGVIYAGLFRMDVAVFMPFIASGFVVWYLISGSVTDSTNAFVAADGIIRQGGIPLSMHIFRVITRNLVIFAHNIVVMIPIYLWQPSIPGWATLLVVPGLALLALNLGWIALILAVLCTRFRDLPPIVTNLLQVALFASPILFKPTLIPPNLSFLVELNPFYYLLEVVRAPLIGAVPSTSVYVVLGSSTILGWVGAIAFYRIVRHRIAYWI
jgi:ABC-type polysaccharide/polyol phosphate export permease